MVVVLEIAWHKLSAVCSDHNLRGFSSSAKLLNSTLVILEMWDVLHCLRVCFYGCAQLCVFSICFTLKSVTVIFLKRFVCG